MSIYEDFIKFVDSDSYVKYFDHNSKYYPCPLSYSHKFEFDFKIFYRTSMGCFVGVSFSSFVRKISVKDYNIVLNRYNDYQEKKQLKKQLIFDI